MIEQCFGGIDVSQDRLDVLLLPQATGFSVANDEAGWKALITRLRDLPVAAIGLEPSGGYERGVLRALLAAGLSVRRINPCRYNPSLKVFHKRLATAGKKPKVIIVAVMRKMITTLNAMLRDGANWQPQGA